MGFFVMAIDNELRSETCLHFYLLEGGGNIFL
jgi:hypothetical protein